MSKVNWLPRPGSSKDGEPIEAPFRIPALIQKVLSLRGFSRSGEIETLFKPKLSEMRDPNSMLDMERTVERLIKAYHAGEKVCVYGDYDLDGSSGLALLYDGLSRLGFKSLTYYQPSRLHEGYGIHAAAVEKLAADGVTGDST